MSDLEQLKANKSALLAKIADVIASIGPLYSVDGQSVDKAGYLKTLQDQIKAINELIQMEEPFMVVSVLR